ncbi:MAG TPA: J domain-containing protein [Candidatus Limnocylindria bacterium]
MSDAEQRDPYAILQVHTNAVPEVIDAAYRALALIHHPDRSGEPTADAIMADLNWAYAVLREPDLRASYDSSQVAIEVEPPAADVTNATLRERVAVAADAAVERDTSNPANTVIDFGRFAGMTLRQIARTDPTYLEWLRRHSSGIRYRAQIDAVLSAMAGSRSAQPSSG